MEIMKKTLEETVLYMQIMRKHEKKSPISGDCGKKTWEKKVLYIEIMKNMVKESENEVHYTKS